MFKNYVVNLVCSGVHLTTWNSPHDVQMKGGGSKAFWTMLKKMHFSYGKASLTKPIRSLHVSKGFHHGLLGWKSAVHRSLLFQIKSGNLKWFTRTNWCKTMNKARSLESGSEWWLLKECPNLKSPPSQRTQKGERRGIPASYTLLPFWWGGAAREEEEHDGTASSRSHAVDYWGESSAFRVGEQESDAAHKSPITIDPGPRIVASRHLRCWAGLD